MKRPRMQRAHVNLYTTLPTQVRPGRLPKTTYHSLSSLSGERGVYPSIARLLNEHRPTTVGALQRALTSGLGADRARAEAEAVTGQMADAFQAGGLAAFLPALATRVAAWQAAGVTAPAVEEALVSIARWPWLRDPADPLPDVPLEDVLRREVAQREKFSALLTVSR